jgi:hypothetical protein
VRPTTERERTDIKMTCGRAVREVGGSNLAKETRVSDAHISRYIALPRNEGGRVVEGDFMPLDVVADLERVIGHPVISEHMVSLHGFRIVPDAGSAEHPDMEDVSEISDTQGKLLSLLIRGALDGKYDHNEAREILPVAEALAAQLDDLIKGMKMIGGVR